MNHDDYNNQKNKISMFETLNCKLDKAKYNLEELNRQKSLIKSGDKCNQLSPIKFESRYNEGYKEVKIHKNERDLQLSLVCIAIKHYEELVRDIKIEMDKI